MAVGSICHSSLLGQEKCCVVLGCCMLKPVLVPSLLCLSRYSITALCQIHQNQFVINLGNFYCNTIDMAHGIQSSDAIQYYIAINIQFKSLAVLTQNQIPLTFPSASRSLSKSSSTNGFAFAGGGYNINSVPQHIFFPFCCIVEF